MTGVQAEPEELAARLRALERVDAALERLAEVGPPSEVVDRAPGEAGEALELDRVLLSRAGEGRLAVQAAWVRGDPEGAAALLARLRAAPARLGYPLLEGEAVRRRRALLVDAGDVPAEHRAFWAVMGWEAYAAAPVVLDGQVIGLLHGERAPGGAALSALDRDALVRFARGFAAVFERAVLRRRLRVQRRELRHFADWADARTSELSDGAIDLSTDRAATGEEPERAPGPDPHLRDLLTRRELDVLEHMVRGESNADIARALVVSEGTVKFHVKNILRKLHAANRAEATSRYLRLSMSRG